MPGELVTRDNLDPAGFEIDTEAGLIRIIGGAGEPPEYIELVVDNSDTAVDGTITELVPADEPALQWFVLGLPPSEDGPSARAALNLMDADLFLEGTRAQIVPLPWEYLAPKVPRGVSVVQPFPQPAYLADLGAIFGSLVGELDYTTPVTIEYLAGADTIEAVLSGIYADVPALMTAAFGPISAYAEVAGSITGDTPRIDQLPNTDPNHEPDSVIRTLGRGADQILEVVSVTPSGSPMDDLLTLTAIPGTDDTLIGPSLSVKGSGDLATSATPGNGYEHHSTDSPTNAETHVATYMVIADATLGRNVWLLADRCEDRFGSLPYAPADPANWTDELSPPSTSQAAVDRLAARVQALEDAP